MNSYLKGVHFKLTKRLVFGENTNNGQSSASVTTKRNRERKFEIPPIKVVFIFCLLLLHQALFAQFMENKEVFTKADTLRGNYGSTRDWWDVLNYDLHVNFNISDSTISGYNTIQYKILKAGKVMQIDLQQPLVIDSILISLNQSKIILPKSAYKREGNVFIIEFENEISTGLQYLTIYYHGKPTIAKRPPWDGGIIWKKDRNKNPFVSIACQGLGGSVWYPCKDHQNDEPDSASMHITIPDSLICIGNGRLRSKIIGKKGSVTYNWAVTNPINNYTIIPYIGKYVNFKENYLGEKGNLDLNYWVLDYNLKAAKRQFKDVPKMMKAFEYWFGPYPFYEDGYKLVEAPHLGMEHQSAIAYGNQFKNGYLGSDLSGSGWGLKWDYIIIHESGHEWFANNISTKDIADMWVHEGFTTYSETLFTEYYYGKSAGEEYVTGLRTNIDNENPIIGPYDVNKEGSGDMYSKGANMIHTIRHIINNDSLFRQILRGMNKTFYHQTVTTKQIENYISERSKIALGKIFDQYLRTIMIPVLEYKIADQKIMYRFSNCIKGFCMPLKINYNGQRWIKPTENWQSFSTNIKQPNSTFSVDRNFYIITKKVD